MTVTVEFDENGSEYVGWFCASGVSRIAFDPEQPKVIRLDGVRIEMDEHINGITVDGYGAQTLSEPWELQPPEGRQEQG